MQTIEERFWSKVNKHGPIHPVLKTRCWLWTGSLNLDGYGELEIDHKTTKAHRVVWLLAHGEYPKPCGLHKCDNPPCVRLLHLYEGTQQGNMQERSLRGRNKSTKLNPQQVQEIRKRAQLGETQTSLGKEFGVNHSTIGLLVNNKTWRTL